MIINILLNINIGVYVLILENYVSLKINKNICSCLFWLVLLLLFCMYILWYSNKKYYVFKICIFLFGL